MNIEVNDCKFYGFEKFEYFKAEVSTQHDTILVLNYLPTKRSRNKKIVAFFIDDIISSNDLMIIGALAEYKKIEWR